MKRKLTKDEARQLLSVPFALTRTVRVPENLRRPRISDSGGHQVWTFDLAINARSAGHGTETIHDNYSAAVTQLPARIDGRVALARKGFLRTLRSLRLLKSTPAARECGTSSTCNRLRANSQNASSTRASASGWPARGMGSTTRSSTTECSHTAGDAGSEAPGHSGRHSPWPTCSPPRRRR